MKSVRSPHFHKLFGSLPEHIQQDARKVYTLWQKDPYHPSLQFKVLDAKRGVWSIRINLGYRALGLMQGDTIIWEWIGTHNAYDKLI